MRTPAASQARERQVAPARCICAAMRYKGPSTAALHVETASARFSTCQQVRHAHEACLLAWKIQGCRFLADHLLTQQGRHDVDCRLHEGCVTLSLLLLLLLLLLVLS